MAFRNRNEAYDISLFEAAETDDKKADKTDNKVLNIPKEKFITKANAKRRVKQMITGVCVGAVVTVFVGIIIQGQVQLTELNQQISNANDTLAEQESLYTQTQMKVESKLSSTVVEEYAQSKLGMTRADNYQKTYISLSDADKAEVAEPDSGNVFDAIANAVAGLWS